MGVVLTGLIYVGFIFGGVFIKPIAKLHDAIEHISKGDLDYKTGIKTGDEIEGA